MERNRSKSEMAASAGAQAALSDAHLEEAVREAVKPLGYMPGHTEFASRFGRRLLWLMTRNKTTPRTWAARLGLEYRPGYRTVSDAELEAQLRELLHGHKEWPGRSFFESRGKRNLYNLAAARGGVAAWAKRLGLRWAAPTPLSDDELLDELKKFCAGRERWPTRREFEDAGRGDLGSMVGKRGGVAVWAPRLGLRYKGRRWDEDSVRDELREFCSGRESSRYPRVRDFLEAGRGDLYGAAAVVRGHAAWAAELGLTYHPCPAPWTEESLEAHLRECLQGRSAWPTLAEWRRIPRGQGLELAIRRFGGHDKWAEKLGLPRHNPKRKLDEDTIEERLRAALAGWDYWPSDREWMKVIPGGPALNSVVKRRGGHEKWAEKLGLPRKGRGHPPLSRK